MDSNYHIFKKSVKSKGKTVHKQNPDERFSTIEFSGAYLLQLDKILDAIRSELPLNFSLKEGQRQATTKPDIPDLVIQEIFILPQFFTKQILQKPKELELEQSGVNFLKARCLFQLLNQTVRMTVLQSA